MLSNVIHTKSNFKVHIYVTMVGKTIKLLEDNTQVVFITFLNRIQDVLIIKGKWVKLKIAVDKNTIKRKALNQISKFVIHINDNKIILKFISLNIINE